MHGLAALSPIDSTDGKKNREEDTLAELPFHAANVIRVAVAPAPGEITGCAEPWRILETADNG